MTLEEAIQTAIDFETRIRDLYIHAAERIPDPVGQRLFKTLADDEQYHIDYLNKKLEQWQRSGQLTLEGLKSSVPDLDAISRNVEKLEKRMAEEDRGDEKQMLSKALTVEIETRDFYRKVVDEMPKEGKDLFSRFLVIEDGHIAAVQAQLDYLNSSGYWFDWKEFDME